MSYGVMTRNEPEIGWSEFDRAFFEVKDVSGRAKDPVADAVNALSCFADNAAAQANPDLVPVSDEGERATRERPYFDWSHVCPCRADYREGLLAMVEDCADVAPDVRLDDVGFPRGEYCHCDVCDEAFAASTYDDRREWRAAVVTDFVREAADRVPGDTILTLHPDPYPGHLYERSGIDLDALADVVDEFVVPLYDTTYGTTYWLEIIASGFADLLDAPFVVELYAVDVDLDDLIHAAQVAEAYADGVVFGYDASQARAALRRMRADERAGETHGLE